SAQRHFIGRGERLRPPETGDIRLRERISRERILSFEPAGYRLPFGKPGETMAHSAAAPVKLGKNDRHAAAYRGAFSITRAAAQEKGFSAPGGNPRQHVRALVRHQRGGAVLGAQLRDPDSVPY